MYEYEEIRAAELAETLNQNAAEGCEVLAAAPGWALIMRETPPQPTPSAAGVQGLRRERKVDDTPIPAPSISPTRIGSGAVPSQERAAAGVRSPGCQLS